MADKTRKELHKILEQFGLKITAEANLHMVNFLDVTFDLTSGKHRPYRKPNDDPLYIPKHSNHPPSILRQLPVSINKRISTLSSDKETFQDAAPTYQTALGHSNFAHKLEYIPHVTHQSRRNRQRNIIWFNPVFSKNINSRQTSHAIFSTSWTHTFPLATNCTKFSTETQLRLATVARITSRT